MPATRKDRPDPLAPYRAKRALGATPEPAGTSAAPPGRRFIVHKHAASHLHYDLRLELEEAIAALPERMRACFVLFAVEELKQSEIAEILDLKLGTVKAHIFQAKVQLRALLSEAYASEVT